MVCIHKLTVDGMSNDCYEHRAPWTCGVHSALLLLQIFADTSVPPSCEMPIGLGATVRMSVRQREEVRRLSAVLSKKVTHAPNVSKSAGNRDFIA